MALKLPIPFPIFAPAILSPNPAPATHRPPSELRFSRWNNANAERFNERRRTLQEIEDNIRRERRFDSADRISRYYDPDTPASAGESFKSTGTPSIPSRPSIPGKKSKYSKNPNRSSDSHPAFRSIRRVSRRGTRVGDRPPPPPEERKAEVRVGDDGVSYVIDGAPFEFKYSYTETPKVKPVKLREAAFAPFGPTTMPRPWTGRAPLPASQKKLREFDSFRLPPPHKKGVKPVQAPGPYLAGSGPKHVMSKEEIMGEPLTSEEVRELVESCKKTKRQMNMGRDGLTHNMLDNIHAHWKRRRVCKIKCKGVCTVDMENVYQQLEERTGGKIIFSQGGVLYLFRGRNYNYRSRPRFPLMLWKPITPVYPRLVKRVPEGMTLEEVAKMRNKGHKLVPICKLGKNGVYNNLVNMVREAFEECELVRINCQGMNGSDYRKIGAKLKDLVPCVLLSFAYEHILIWRGHDWKSALPKLDTLPEEDKESDTNNTTSIATSLEDQEVTTARITIDNETPEVDSGITAGHENEDSLSVEYVESFPTATEVLNSVTETEDMCVIQSRQEGSTVSYGSIYTTMEPQIDADASTTEIRLENVNTLGGSSTEILGSNTILPEVEIMETELDSVEEDLITTENQQVTSEASQDVNQSDGLYSPCTEVVLSLLQQALESGSAMILDDADLDSDIVYQKTVTFSKSAPPGPVFKLRPRKIRVKISEVQENEKKDIEDSEDLEPQDRTTAYVREGNQKKGSNSKTRRKKDGVENIEFVVPHGSLRVDELAKLLA